MRPSRDPQRRRLAEPASGGAGDADAPIRRLTSLQRILLETDGTMTFLLEACTGEGIEAVKLHQEFAGCHGAEQGALALAVGAPVLRRLALLRGTRTGRVFVYAAAVVAIDRIDPRVVDALVTTDAPIGRLLAQSRTETFRDILHRGTTPAGPARRYLDLSAGADVLFRTYRIHSGGRPIMLITERFPPHLFLALPDEQAGVLDPGPLPPAARPASSPPTEPRRPDGRP